MKTTTDPRPPAFLSIPEAAVEARLSPKRFRNLMATGVLQEGIHFTRPAGLRPRIRRDALMRWLNGEPLPNAPAPTRRPPRGRGKLNPELLAVSRRRPRR